jgi:hypothetical protein
MQAFNHTRIGKVHLSYPADYIGKLHENTYKRLLILSGSLSIQRFVFSTILFVKSNPKCKRNWVLLPIGVALIMMAENVCDLLISLQREEKFNFFLMSNFNAYSFVIETGLLFPAWIISAIYSFDLIPWAYRLKENEQSGILEDSV